MLGMKSCKYGIIFQFFYFLTIWGFKTNEVDTIGSVQVPTLYITFYFKFKLRKRTYSTFVMDIDLL